MTAAWMISANVSVFDIDQAFRNLECIDWGVNGSAIQTGDNVLVYSTDPVKALTHEGVVVNADVSAEDLIDDRRYWIDPAAMGALSQRRYVRLKLTRTFAPQERERLCLSELRAAGLKAAPRRPVSVPPGVRQLVSVVTRWRHAQSDDAAFETVEYDESEVEEHAQAIERGDYAAASTTTSVISRGSAQQAFSRRVKGNYGYRCAVTGISTPEFLVGSHIVPWSVDESIRIDPRNGLCLSTLLDRAFDTGFLTFTDDLTVSIIRSRVSDDRALGSLLEEWDGAPLELPKREAPVREYLRRRRELFAEPS